jgi:hypothetical protein
LIGKTDREWARISTRSFKIGCTRLLEDDVRNGHALLFTPQVHDSHQRKALLGGEIYVNIEEAKAPDDNLGLDLGRYWVREGLREQQRHTRSSRTLQTHFCRSSRSIGFGSSLNSILMEWHIWDHKLRKSGAIEQ